MMDHGKVKIELEVCQSEMDKLPFWEQSFIESITDQYSRKGILSKAQCDKLHQIYEKVV